MEIKKNLVPENKYKIKCPYRMTPEFIVVHNTANDASAANEITYMRRNNNETSFHFAVDDKEIIQGLPLDRNGWHAGDGDNGRGNRKGIAIEICYSKSGGERFIAAEKLAAKFIAELLHERGWGVKQVKKHQDFSPNKKYCPHRTLKMGWQRFLNMIQDELDALKKPKKEPAEDGPFYRVQVGAFEEKENAEEKAEDLEVAGFDTYIVKVGGLYKVQTGAFKERADAEAQLANVKAAGFSAFINTNTEPKKEEKPAEKELKVGDRVRVAKNAPNFDYIFKFDDWVYNATFYVREVSGRRVVIAPKPTGAVTGAVSSSYLTKV